MQQANLEIKRGDTWARTLYFKDEDGSIIDITGWTIFMTAKESIDDDDDDAVIKKTITEHTNPTSGETKIILTPDETDLEIKSYVYDIQILKATLEVVTILEGSITVAKDVTQRIA